MRDHRGKILRALPALLLAALLGAVGLAGGQEVSKSGAPWLSVTVGQITLKAEAVRTPKQLYRGLSYRRGLPEGQGMLFVMPEMEVQVFCMRGMLFPLDFIWIRDGRVAGLTRNVPPDFTGNLSSPVPVNYVLEVPAGFADKYAIQVGDPVRW
jgi:uncharacterized membrane protein (UPF0127 family)